MDDVIPRRERTFGFGKVVSFGGIVKGPWFQHLMLHTSGCTFEMEMNEDVSDPVSISSEIIAECTAKRR